METLPPITPPLPRVSHARRDLASSAPFDWLKAGWRDLWTNPAPSLAYGLFVALISAGVVYFLVRAELDYVMFPALSAFMIVAPVLAVGLYEKSRRLSQGESVTLFDMIFVRAKSTGQILFMGVLLALLALVWMRAAVILYALFFGVKPFAGFDDVTQVLLNTPRGIALLIVGTMVGGLFAAFSFAISAFSIPMLLDQKSDALTAMGTSMALVWNNLGVLIVWGALVMVLAMIGSVTAFIGFIIIFPLLGHATWRAYESVKPKV